MPTNNNQLSEPAGPLPAVQVRTETRVFGEDSPIYISGGGLPIKVSWSLIVQTTITLVALVASVVGFRASFQIDINALKVDIVNLQRADDENRAHTKEILSKLNDLTRLIDEKTPRLKNMEEQLMIMNDRLWNGRIKQHEGSQPNTSPAR